MAALQPMNNALAALALLVAGVIHLLPLPGLLGAGMLRRLYGVEVADPNLLIMLQHRALLFGLLGAALVVAAFRPDWRLWTATAGLLSAAGFLVVALLVGGYNAALGRVVVADVVAVVCLVAALALERLGRTAATA